MCHLAQQISKQCRLTVATDRMSRAPHRLRLVESKAPASLKPAYMDLSCICSRRTRSAADSVQKLYSCCMHQTHHVIFLRHVLCYARLCCVVLCYASHMLCYTLSSSMLCYVMPCCATCYAMPVFTCALGSVCWAGKAGLTVALCWLATREPSPPLLGSCRLSTCCIGLLRDCIYPLTILYCTLSRNGIYLFTSCRMADEHVHS